jgi:hypothetical protein
MFAAEPFTEREAWAWLIAEAAFKAHRRRVGGFQVDLKRGQLAASVRFLAEKWRWHRNKVDRFLERLKIGTMIGTETGTGITVITICNYDKYQRVSLPSETGEETATGTAAGQQRDKVEDKEYKEKNAPAAPDPEKELFDRGKIVLGKQAGGLIVSLLKAKKGDIALARAAIETASTKSNPREYIGAIVRGPPAREGEFVWKSGIPGVL